MRLLVIEDNKMLAHSLRRGFREEGFAVDVAADGEEGLWYAEPNPYDVIVLDLTLPKLDGLELLRQWSCCSARGAFSSISTSHLWRRVRRCLSNRKEATDEESTCQCIHSIHKRHHSLLPCDRQCLYVSPCC